MPPGHDPSSVELTVQDGQVHVELEVRRKEAEQQNGRVRNEIAAEKTWRKNERRGKETTVSEGGKRKRPDRKKRKQRKLETCLYAKQDRHGSVLCGASRQMLA